MERGTSRVRAVLGNGAAMAQTAEPPQRCLGEGTNGAESAQRPQVQPATNATPPAAAESAQRPQMRPAANATPPAAAESSASTAATFTARPAANGAPKKQPEQTARRGNSGSTLMIAQPPSGDMSEVTISLWGSKSESTDTPSKNGQRPTSVTYERCTAGQHDTCETEPTDGEERQLWIDTPNFSGPDRRHVSVSPDVERRKTVPPRLKVGVRLEQERYLRLKLACQDTKRTQQDLITSALDSYLDEIGVDRFVRIAMGFGGATATVGQDAGAVPDPDTKDR
jgi:hypothetical protein